MPYNAGSAFLSVVPSFQGFVDACDKQATEAAKSAGEAFSKVWAETVRSATNGANIGPSEEALARQGEEDASRYSEAFQARLDAAHATVKVDADTKNADTAMTGLVATAAALAPAVAGAIGPFAAGLAAVGVSGYAAAGGVAAFVLAAEPGLKAAEVPAKALVTTWQNANATFTDPVIARALGLVTPALDLLTPSVRATAGALGQLEPQVQAALGSPYWRQFSTYAAGEGATAIGSFSTAFGGLAHLFAGVAQGMAPEIARIDADISKWGGDMAKWGNEAQNGGMQGFMSWVQTNGPLAAKAVEQIANDIIVLAKASAPLSGIWLKVINVAAQLVGDLEKMNSPLTTWALGLGSAALAVNRLTSSIGGLPGLIKGVGGAWTLATDAIATGTTGIAAIAQASGGAAGALTDVAGGLAAIPGAGDIAAAAILQVTGQLGNFTEGADKAGVTYAKQFVANLPAGTNAVAAVGLEIARQQGALNSFTSAMKAAGDSGDYFNTKVEDLPPSMSALKNTLIANGANPAQQVSDAYAGFGNSIDAIDGKIKALKSGLNNLTPAQRAQALAAGQAALAAAQAAGYNGNAALSYAQLTGAIQQTNSQLKQQLSNLDALLGVDLSSAQATTAFWSSLQALGASLKQNGKDMRDTTAAGNANKTAFEQVASAAFGIIKPMADGGATAQQTAAKTRQLTADVEAVGAQYGLTKPKVDALLRSMGLTPKQIVSNFYASGVEQSESKIAGYHGQINALPNNKTTALYTSGVPAAIRSIGQVAGWLNTLPSQKNVLINITTRGGGVGAGIGAGLATGTTYATAGWHPVAEKGPEIEEINGRLARVFTSPQIAYIPQGAEILNASQTAKLLAQPRVDLATPRAIAALPAPTAAAAVPAGPAVAIDKATFTEAADIDILMRRAALAQKARSV